MPVLEDPSNFAVPNVDTVASLGPTNGENDCRNYFIFNLNKSCVARLGSEFRIPGSAITCRYLADCIKILMFPPKNTKTGDEPAHALGQFKASFIVQTCVFLELVSI